MRIPFREKFAYGLGDVGNNLLFNLGQIYLLKFYTDSLGLPPAWAGMVFLFTKIFFAFTDVAVGTWIDRRKNYGKYGKFRTVMFYAVIPLALCTAVSFYNPDFTLTGKIVWAYFSYTLFGVVYTFFNIPFGSSIPAATKDPIDRAGIASARQFGGSVGLLVVMVAFVPLVTICSSQLGEQYGFFVAAGVIAIAGGAMQWLCAHGIRERYVEPPKLKEANISVWKSYRDGLSNAPMLVLSLVNLFTFSAFNVKLAVQVYYCQYVLHNIDISSLYGFFSVGGIILGVSCVQPMVRRYGKKITYISGIVVWAVADILALFFVNDTVSFVIFASLAFFGSGFTALNWAFISDAIEYGEWKTGYRSEGTIYSLFIFFRKISQAVAGFVPGIVLAMVGYVANQEYQTETAIEGIRGLMFMYSGVMAVATVLVMAFGYKLTDQRYQEIMTDLNQRKASSCRLQ